MRTANFAGAKNTRRVNALHRLDAQLEKGTKPAKLEIEGMDIQVNSLEVPLTDEDIVRIKKEIAILESRVLTDEAAAQTRTKKNRSGGGYRR
jgi:hypothetical protein